MEEVLPLMEEEAAKGAKAPRAQLLPLPSSHCSNESTIGALGRMSVLRTLLHAAMESCKVHTVNLGSGAQAHRLLHHSRDCSIPCLCGSTCSHVSRWRSTRSIGGRHRHLY